MTDLFPFLKLDDVCVVLPHLRIGIAISESMKDLRWGRGAISESMNITSGEGKSSDMTSLRKVLYKNEDWGTP